MGLPGGTRPCGEGGGAIRVVMPQREPHAPGDLSLGDRSETGRDLGPFAAVLPPGQTSQKHEGTLWD